MNDDSLRGHRHNDFSHRPLAVVAPLAVRADVHCYDIENCSICDFWNGTTYAGFIRWCRVI